MFLSSVILTSDAEVDKKCEGKLSAILNISEVIKAPANEDTLLPTQMLPRLPARATFVADTKNASDLFRNILCLQQMFPSLRSMETQHSFIMSDNVSATMCPRLPGPLSLASKRLPIFFKEMYLVRFRLGIVFLHREKNCLHRDFP